MLSRFAERRTGAWSLALLLCVGALAACAQEDDEGPYVVDAGAANPGTPVVDAGGAITPADTGTSGPTNPNPTIDAAPTGTVDARVDPPAEAGPVATVDAGGSDASSTGTPDAGNTSTDASTTPTDKGKGDGKDVIAIGDSWMNYALNGGGIQRGLLAASGQKYRTYAVAGTKLLDEVIPRQYASAKRENPNIKTVVMTGGGNDILLGFSLESAMSVIDKVSVRLDSLWQEMAKDGVQDVVYIEYSEGGNNGDNVRYGIQKVGPVCMNFKALRCHFMLSDPIINKQLLDGIHPTSDGCTKLGKAAFDLMVKEGMRR